MTEAGFLLILAILTGAIGKLWADLRAVIIAESKCSIALAVLETKMDSLQESVSVMRVETAAKATKEAVKEIRVATAEALAVAPASPPQPDAPIP